MLNVDMWLKCLINVAEENSPAWPLLSSGEETER